jgi:hypothetical protein
MALRISNQKSEIRNRLSLLPLAALLVASCETPVPPPAKRPTRLETQLARREKGLDAASGRLKAAAKEVSPKAEDVPPKLKDLVGVDRMKAEIEKIRQAVARVSVTDQDATGLAAYCAGEHAEARRQFIASDAQQPNREFPVYFLGAMAFQEGNWAQARDFLTKTVARNPRCRSAYLLRRLATLCQGRGAAGAAQLLLLFEQACRETAKELALDPKAQSPSVANVFVPQLASDPVLFKAQELLGDIARKHFWELGDALTDAKTPEEKLGLVLLMGDTPVADTLIQGLAEEYRSDPEIRTFAFLHRYFAASTQGRPREHLAADLAAVSALDKDNGALLLLAIPAKPSAPEGRTTLSDEEITLLGKAARAKEFCTYAAYRRPQRLAGYLAAFGALLPYAPMTQVPSIYGHLAGVARRAAATVAALLEQGKVDEALKLTSDVEAIAARAWEETKNAKAQLLQDAVADALYGQIQAYAAKGERKPLVASCVERRAAVCRHKADRLVAWDTELLTLFRMPVRRLVEAAMELEDSPTLIQQFAALKLKADPQRYFKQAMDLLADVPDDDVPDAAYEQVVILGRLRNRSAVPRLITLAGHPDRLLAHLAARAFTAIAEDKE